MKVRGLNLRQRIVLVVGLGVGLEVFGQWATTRVYGWVAYAPLSGSSISGPGGLSGWEDMLIWFGLILVWVVASVALLRSPRQD